MHRQVLLIKAQGDFKHSGKYFLQNGRWHKLHPDKPAPKGAPVAAHPKAAGNHAPVAHFTDDEWQKLKLPAENSNAGTFNKQLEQLKQLSDAGDVTGILGMQLGTNTYGKKLSTIANHLLGLHGSEHKVAPGQKAGEHAAVQQAPAEHSAASPATEPKAEEKPAAPAEKPAASKPDAIAKFQASHAKQGTPSTTVDGKDWFVVGTGTTNDEGKVYAHLASKTEGQVQKNGFVPKQMADWIDPATISDPKKTAAAAASKATGLPMPAFVEGKTTTGVVSYYEAQAQKILDMAAAGDVEGLAAMKEDGLKPNSKGKVSNTFKGKTENSKTLLALHAQAVVHAKGGATAEQPAPAAEASTPAPAEPSPAEKVKQATQAATAAVAQTPEHQEAVAIATASLAGSKVSQIPWDSQLLPDSNKNAKSHNKQVAKIQAMAEAGDLAGLEALKFGTNTYGKKQEKLKQLAIAALQEDAAAPVPAAAPAPAEKKGYDKYGIFDSLTSDIDTAASGGDASTLKDIESYLNTPAHKNEPGLDAIKKYLDRAKASVATPAAPAAEQGPKEGDTKQGADGMLVFKDGRWHKQAEPAAAAPEPAPAHPIDAVPMPELTFSSAASNAKVAAALEKLKEQIKAEGPGALKGVTKHMKSKGKYIVSLPGTYGSLKVYGYEHAPDHAGTKVHAYIEALKAAAGKPSKAPAKAKAKNPVVDADGIQSMDSWKKTGEQAGSNPGGKFKDENGVEWYCKFPSDEDVAKSEVLAAKLYAVAGVIGQDAKLIKKDGKLGIASRWTTVSKAAPKDLAKAAGAQSGFAVDAWLANWDVVGMGFDNLQVGPDGKAVRVDAGGSLTYRAQGGKKAFGATVAEIDSMRDAKVNAQSAAVFGSMTQADLTASVAKVAAIPDSAIKNLVELHGPGDAAERKALADTLIARKNDLIAKYPKAAKTPKKRLDPNSLPVDPDRLPKAHDFNNWLGAGKPLSSQPHVNAANMAVEQELLALAKTGNLTKLKDFQFHAIDKATGNQTGQLIPIAEHPSKHVVQLHADLVMALDEIANPPQPLKVFQETDVGTIDQLAAALPSKKFGTTVTSVHSNEKLGFWVVLGTAHGAAKFKPSKVMDYSSAAIAAAKEKFQQASHLAKHFIYSVQASGSYNDLFRAGKSHDHAGNKLSDVAKAALEHATTMPEGTSLYRWQSIPDDMVKKILDAPDGTVFQATGPMCTSYHPTGTAGFGKHRVTVRYANGAKAVESFASGKFSGEKEVTTLPNSRFVILKKEMVPDVEHGNPGGKRLELEVLMLPPDMGL